MLSPAALVALEVAQHGEVEISVLTGLDERTHRLAPVPAAAAASVLSPAASVALTAVQLGETEETVLTGLDERTHRLASVPAAFDADGSGGVSAEERAAHVAAVKAQRLEVERHQLLMEHELQEQLDEMQLKLLLNTSSSDASVDKLPVQQAPSTPVPSTHVLQQRRDQTESVLRADGVQTLPPNELSTTLLLQELAFVREESARKQMELERQHSIAQNALTQQLREQDREMQHAALQQDTQAAAVLAETRAALDAAATALERKHVADQREVQASARAREALLQSKIKASVVEHKNESIEEQYQRVSDALGAHFRTDEDVLHSCIEANRQLVAQVTRERSALGLEQEEFRIREQQLQLREAEEREGGDAASLRSVQLVDGVHEIERMAELARAERSAHARAAAAEARMEDQSRSRLLEMEHSALERRHAALKAEHRDAMAATAADAALHAAQVEADAVSGAAAITAAEDKVLRIEAAAAARAEEVDDALAASRAEAEALKADLKRHAAEYEVASQLPMEQNELLQAQLQAQARQIQMLTIALTREARVAAAASVGVSVDPRSALIETHREERNRFEEEVSAQQTALAEQAEARVSSAAAAGSLDVEAAALQYAEEHNELLASAQAQLSGLDTQHTLACEALERRMGLEGAHNEERLAPTVHHGDRLAAQEQLRSEAALALKLDHQRKLADARAAKLQQQLEVTTQTAAKFASELQQQLVRSSEERGALMTDASEHDRVVNAELEVEHSKNSELHNALASALAKASADKELEVQKRAALLSQCERARAGAAGAEQALRAGRARFATQRNEFETQVQRLQQKSVKSHIRTLQHEALRSALQRARSTARVAALFAHNCATVASYYCATALNSARLQACESAAAATVQAQQQLALTTHEKDKITFLESCIEGERRKGISMVAELEGRAVQTEAKMERAVSAALVTARARVEANAAEAREESQYESERVAAATMLEAEGRLAEAKEQWAHQHNLKVRWLEASVVDEQRKSALLAQQLSTEHHVHGGGGGDDGKVEDDHSIELQIAQAELDKCRRQLAFEEHRVTETSREHDALRVRTASAANSEHLHLQHKYDSERARLLLELQRVSTNERMYAVAAEEEVAAYWERMNDSEAYANARVSELAQANHDLRDALFAVSRSLEYKELAEFSINSNNSVRVHLDQQQQHHPSTVQTPTRASATMVVAQRARRTSASAGQSPTADAILDGMREAHSVKAAMLKEVLHRMERNQVVSTSPLEAVEAIESGGVSLRETKKRLEEMKRRVSDMAHISTSTGTVEQRTVISIVQQQQQQQQVESVDGSAATIVFPSATSTTGMLDDDDDVTEDDDDLFDGLSHAIGDRLLQSRALATPLQ